MAAAAKVPAQPQQVVPNSFKHYFTSFCNLFNAASLSLALITTYILPMLAFVLNIFSIRTDAEKKTSIQVFIIFLGYKKKLMQKLCRADIVGFIVDDVIDGN